MRNIDGYMYDSLPNSIKTFIRRKESEWQNWTDEQIVAWIYTSLGEKYSMDPNYRYGDSRTKQQIESSASDIRNLNNRLNRTNVTCIDLARIMEIILNDVFFINCKTVMDGSGPHHYNIVDVSGKRLKLDLQQDLYNIQSGRRLENFGKDDFYDGKNFSIFKPEELDSILESIGYNGIPYKNSILDKHISRLKEKNLPLNEKLEIVLLATSLEYGDRLPKMGYCERTELFKQCILDSIYSEESDARKKRSFGPDSEISHETEKVNGKYVSCFSVRNSDGSKKHYMNNGTGLKYEEIDEKTYQKIFSKVSELPDAPTQ